MIEIDSICNLFKEEENEIMAAKRKISKSNSNMCIRIEHLRWVILLHLMFFSGADARTEKAQIWPEMTILHVCAMRVEYRSPEENIFPVNS
jgi:hypothetical protein